MNLSVIILNYKVPAHLLLCVDSVVKATKGIDAEIIVADNHSEDNSLALLTQYFPGVLQIPISENLGFSKGNNKAIAQAKGKYICLLNPDVVVPENTFVEALNYAETKTDLGALGVQLIDGSGKFLPESKRNTPNPKVAIAKLLGFSKSYYANQIDREENAEVPVLVGAFMLMEKETYLEVGGLDETYFMYGEDIDLSYQLQKNNFKNHYIGSISCLHFKGESTVKDEAFRKRFFDAMQLFYQKHFNSHRFSLALVNWGLQLARSLHLGIPKTKEKKDLPTQAFLVSTNPDLLKKTPKKLNTRLIEKHEIQDLKNKNAYLIFDAAYISYQEIIESMKRLSDTAYRFRIVPRMHQLMLGSDSSTMQGEVFWFK